MEPHDAHGHESYLLTRALETGIVSDRQLLDARRRLRESGGDARPASVIERLIADGAVTRADLERLHDSSLVGETLGGFRIEAKLGDGGVGAVFRARQESLGRVVALKVLHPHLAQLPEAVERFLLEARTAARLQHPHLVTPFDVGEEDGFTFFAMEFLPRGSVAQRVDREGPLPEHEALRITRQVATALEEVSRRGLVHRDVKPDNILLAEDGTPKLADLGLVKDRAAARPMTKTGVILGTPNYMAPEQAQLAEDLDVRSDLYSLGVSLYEMVTGVMPYDALTPMSVLVQQIVEPLPDAREKAPDLSEGAARLIAWMTEKDRDRRPASAKAVLEAIDAILEGSALPAALAPPPPHAPASGPAPPRDPADADVRPAPPHARTPGWVWPVVALALMAGAAAIASRLVSPPPPEKVASAPPPAPAPRPTPPAPTGAAVQLSALWDRVARESARAVFDELREMYDTDRDGRIARAEVEAALAAGQELSEEFDLADQDRDGRVDLEELTRLWRRDYIIDLVMLFGDYDRNGDGVVSFEELGPELAPEYELDDTDGDRRITPLELALATVGYFSFFQPWEDEAMEALTEVEWQALELFEAIAAHVGRLVDRAPPP